MNNKFDLFRMTLQKIEQKSLLDQRNLKRLDYLKEAFKERVKFEHSKKPFYYVPSSITSKGDIIIGRIGRSSEEIINLPPENELAEASMERWTASVIAIDPTEHKDGQKISFQRRQQVGSTKAVLQSLIKHMNELDPVTPYHISISQIFNAQSFWDFAKENQGKITNIALEVLMPNMAEIEDEFTKDLENYRDKQKARKMKFELQSDEGLEIESDYIKQGVNYTEKGNGHIRAKTKKK